MILARTCQRCVARGYYERLTCPLFGSVRQYLRLRCNCICALPRVFQRVISPASTDTLHVLISRMSPSSFTFQDVGTLVIFLVVSVMEAWHFCLALSSERLGCLRHEGLWKLVMTLACNSLAFRDAESVS